jgi:hypothetical protein
MSTDLETSISCGADGGHNAIHVSFLDADNFLFVPCILFPSNAMFRTITFSTASLPSHTSLQQSGRRGQKLHDSSQSITKPSRSPSR